MGKVEEVTCQYHGSTEDDVYQTLFECERSRDYKSELHEEVGPFAIVVRYVG